MRGRRPVGPEFPFWIEIPLRNPWILGLVGLAVAAAMVPLFFMALDEYRSSTSDPVLTTFQEAAAIAEGGGETWVTLTNVAWDCGQTIQEGKVVILSTQTGRRFVAELASGTSCSDASQGAMTGVLKTLRQKRREWLVGNAGLQLSPSDEPALMLCTYCGGDNAKLGLFLAPTLSVLGLAMYPIGRAARRHYYGY